MDLDDSFTEKLLERIKARKARKDSLNRRKRTVLAEVQQILNEGETGHKESPRCLYVEQVTSQNEEKDHMEQVKENIYGKEEEVPFMKRGLAAMRKKHSDQEYLNEKRVPQDKQQVVKPSANVFSAHSKEKCSTLKNRLANLAADISCWEDNLRRSAVSTSSSAKVAHDGSGSQTNEVNVSKTNEQEAWNNMKEKGKEVEEQKPVFKKEKTLQSNFRAKEVEVALNCSFEPSNLPVSARKALFEQSVLSNKAQQKQQAFELKLSVTQRAGMFENGPKHRSKPISHSPTKALQSSKVDKGSPVKPSHRSPTKLPVLFYESPSRLSAALTGSSAKPSVASIENPAKPSLALSQGSPAKLLATGGSVNTPPKSFIPKPSSTPPMSLSQQKWVKATGTDPEKKRPLSALVSHWEKLSSPSNVGNDQSEEKLEKEIEVQDNIIGQTRQLFASCCTKPESVSSTEEIEGLIHAEGVLLTATQKRQAYLNEIQRLKSNGAHAAVAEDGYGTLTITNLELPLKREFIAAHFELKTNDDHYFLCLVRYGPQVIETQMVSTNDGIVDGSLHFTNLIQFMNLPPDFCIVFEVFTMETKKESVSHYKKFGIRDFSRLSFKGKKGERRNPAINSTGGQHTERTSNFRVVGYTVFTLQNCTKKCFTLDEIPLTSPLEGILKVKLKLHVEHNVAERGFLTMFEDVSGFGAWLRRWCTLENHRLCYWKYPDEENRQDAIGTIDLHQCITKEVRVVSRDICARPRTFQLVEVRPRKKCDRDTLISQSHGALTTTKWLLSADTREERERWCQQLNNAIRYIRLWDPKALAPTQ